jgi:hypothetical protein
VLAMVLEHLEGAYGRWAGTVGSYGILTREDISPH